MAGWGKLPDQTKKDLRTWFNCEPDYQELTLLARLYLSGKFQAWDCPECGERVYWGDPDDWNNFQGVLQADYTSYPGNAEKYQPDYLVKLCDDCRMKC